MSGNSFWKTVGIILLVLILMGVVSIGDIIGVAAKIIMSIILIILVFMAIFAYRIHRVRRNMGQQSNGYHTGGFNRQQSRHGGRSSREGDVTLQNNSSQKKGRVNSKVGDYVDFKDVE